MHCVADCIIRRVVPQPTEWQHIGNQINAAPTFAGPNVVNVHLAFDILYGNEAMKFGGGKHNSRLFEIALVLVRLDHVASVIVNANHSIG